MTPKKTVDVAQSVRASVCGAEGRGFEPHLPPSNLKAAQKAAFFLPEKKRSIFPQKDEIKNYVDINQYKASECVHYANYFIR